MLRTIRNRTNALVAALGTLWLFACVGGQIFDGKPQGWWKERGPVVPHETFPASCDLCHEGDDWVTLRSDFSFDHLAETGVPLEGAHARAECLRCHNDRGPAELFAARGCAGCHEDVHEGLQGKECSTCHEQDTWGVIGAIAEHARTRFPLVGAHAQTSCRRCHEGIEAGILAPLDVECVSCHQADLARAASPNHLANGWVASCDRCHIPTSWTGAGFNHRTFPLTGAHRAADCSECHAGGVFGGTPRDCVSCHLGDYQGTTDPNHALAGFSTECQMCHSTTTWSGATFGHTTFPLTGAHQGADCAECHVGGVFAGTPNDCAACHLAEYQGTSDPNHQAAGFPLTCEICHNTGGWGGAQFDHTFRINGGPHGSFDCTECHQIPMNYQTASCIHCHEHRQSEANKEHSGVGGYVWSSPACIACHPTGKE